MTEQSQPAVSEFVTQPVKLAAATVQVTASPTATPHLVVTPMLGRLKDGRLVLNGKLALTHAPTGRHITVGDSFDSLNALAQQLAEFDWEFTDPNHTRSMSDAATVIREWQLAGAYQGPATLWSDDDELKAAREREPATTLLAEHLQWWIDHSKGIRESELYDKNRDAWYANMSTSVMAYGLIYLLAVVRTIDPKVADIAARDLVSAFDAGDSLGEWVWQWRDELAQGHSLTLHGIPTPDPLNWSPENPR